MKFRAICNLKFHGAWIPGGSVFDADKKESESLKGVAEPVEEAEKETEKPEPIEQPIGPTGEEKPKRTRKAVAKK